MIRVATLSDLSAITVLKLKMFKEVGKEHMLRDDFLQVVENTYKELYDAGRATHFVIEQEHTIVACAGAFIKEDIPYCFYKEAQYGFIGDVYVEHEFRNQGYARMLTNEVIAWLSLKEINTVRLLASDQAKMLYKSIGFKETDEMILQR
ncbi:GNAT family N-acetyltransferase [Aureibacillus halotolerans]|uniref:Ribosomal protein S18 acetylase RimI-like enzyme n=1 Tax=Aureibacillus halotolerans TaxID=1508390 RepID=A0A4V3D5U2_9BACI|nr:GNAT family N-acetyltransferase [Aureibacillus halotolerans]TDQ41457.1 ribosomal protein S18 acetylase RimI-like enzyme [Aureibacillus halotolerans]